MHTIELYTLKKVTKPMKKIQIPSDLDELTPEQYQYFLQLIGLAQSGVLDYTDIQTRMVYFILGMKHHPRIFNNKSINSDETREQICYNISTIADLLDFLFIIEDHQGDRQFQPARTIHNFFPKIKNLYGPEDAFQNLSVIEYVHARDHFLNYAKTQEEKHLNNLVATLYRPKKWFHSIRKKMPSYDGQIRQKYNDNTVESRFKKVSKIAPELKFAVYLYFLECENFIKTSTINVGGSFIDLSVLFKSSDDDGGGVSDDLGMLGILYKVAETGVFGNMEGASQTNLYDMLLKLYQNHIDYINNKPKPQAHEN